MTPLNQTHDTTHSASPSAEASASNNRLSDFLESLGILVRYALGMDYIDRDCARETTFDLTGLLHTRC